MYVASPRIIGYPPWLFCVSPEIPNLARTKTTPLPQALGRRVASIRPANQQTAPSSGDSNVNGGIFGDASDAGGAGSDAGGIHGEYHSLAGEAGDNNQATGNVDSTLLQVSVDDDREENVVLYDDRGDSDQAKALGDAGKHTPVRPVPAINSSNGTTREDIFYGEDGHGNDVEGEQLNRRFHSPRGTKRRVDAGGPVGGGGGGGRGGGGLLRGSPREFVQAGKLGQPLHDQVWFWRKETDLCEA